MPVNIESKSKIQFVIRNATLSDLERIAKIEIENHDESDCDTPLDRMLNNIFLNEYKKRWRKKLLDGVKTLLISVQRRSIGFITYTLNEYDAEIHNIYILPLHRRQHFGKSLCLHALKKIKKAGKQSVNVWLVTGRTQIIKFYRSLGFTATTHVRIDNICKDINLPERLFMLSFVH